MQVGLGVFWGSGVKGLRFRLGVFWVRGLGVSGLRLRDCTGVKA